MYDKIIIGAGIYGLYSAIYCGRKGEKVLVLEYENEPFKRATYINQARVHQGYHYPRSLSTALKSANYFDRFNKDFEYAINKEFNKIYAISKNFSWSNAEEFHHFCKSANIPCKRIMNEEFFKDEMCEGTFLTNEYTYDAKIICEHLLKEITKMKNVTIVFSSPVIDIKLIDKKKCYAIITKNKTYESKYVLNCTYGSTNQILDMLGFEKFKIKYELCEIILVKPNKKLKDYGITVMDGPFFSIMPFGKTPYHSLTSVTFTPHQTSFSELPKFECQKRCNGFCSPKRLGNCNECPAKPKSAWPYMFNLTKKYLKEDFQFEYVKSLFSIKPILVASEIDDSRPTLIKKNSVNPTFVSVLSGKINTVYDLEEVLDEK